MLDKARMSMEAGATGLIFGRNVWQREHGESLRIKAEGHRRSIRSPLLSRPWARSNRGIGTSRKEV
jgi:hypothetical protein